MEAKGEEEEEEEEEEGRMLVYMVGERGAFFSWCSGCRTSSLLLVMVNLKQCLLSAERKIFTCFVLQSYCSHSQLSRIFPESLLVPEVETGRCGFPWMLILAPVPGLLRG